MCCLQITVELLWGNRLILWSINVVAHAISRRVFDDNYMGVCRSGGQTAVLADFGIIADSLYFLRVSLAV